MWLLTNREALEACHGIAAVFKMKGKRTHGLEGWREGCGAGNDFRHMLY